MRIRKLAWLVLAISAAAAASCMRSGPLARQSISEDDVARAERKTKSKLYRPALSEFPFLIEAASDPPSRPPAFLNDPKYAYVARETAQPVSSIPGERFYDLSQPPRIRYYWKIPLYALFGAPRDLIDMLFGACSRVPPFNLAFTGAYEFSGLQFLVRHRQDWHEYGGYSNAAGHGWIDGVNGWGWFSNYRNARFSEIDEARLESWKKHNAALEAKLNEKNVAAAGHREMLQGESERYLAIARADYEAGRFQDALARLWAYLRATPTDYDAKARYLACCARFAGQGGAEADWARAEIRRMLREWPLGSVSALCWSLKNHVERWPDDQEARYWLVWAYARLSSYAEALEESAALLQMPGAGVREQLLVFEICLERLQQLSKPEDARAAADLLARMEKSVAALRGAGPEAAAAARFCEGRLKVMKGEYHDGLMTLLALSNEAPGDPRFSYAFGAGHMLQGIFGGDYDWTVAVNALTRARQTAKSPERLARIDLALAEARTLVAARPVRIPEVAE